jgi:hypothetical protein
MIRHQCVAEPVPLASNLQPFGACTQVPTSVDGLRPVVDLRPKPIDRSTPLTGRERVGVPGQIADEASFEDRG